MSNLKKTKTLIHVRSLSFWPFTSASAACYSIRIHLKFLNYSYAAIQSPEIKLARPALSSHHIPTGRLPPPIPFSHQVPLSSPTFSGTPSAQPTPALTRQKLLVYSPPVAQPAMLSLSSVPPCCICCRAAANYYPSQTSPICHFAHSVIYYF